MITQNLVSIIIPVYNVEEYVKECLESVINQTYRNIEIIVIDDGSIDNSQKICEDIALNDSRLKIISQRNQGVVKARGAGIVAATGKYIMFVDSDDRIETNMVEELVKNIENVDMVSSGINLEVPNGNVIKKQENFAPGTYDIDIILKKMIFDNEKGTFQNLIYSMWNKLYKLDILRKVYFNIDPEITFGEDSVLVCKYLLNCKSIKILEECFYHYRLRENSAIRSYKDDRLTITNKIYNCLKTDFEKHEFKDELMYQLEMLTKNLAIWSVNEGMGFHRSEKIRRFIINTYGLENKKIVVYGAGELGKDAYRQLVDFGYNTVLWVDQAWQDYKLKGLNVSSPAELFNIEYDVILIAVYDETLSNKIKQGLLTEGIQQEKIRWKQSIALY